jgi:2-methylisocitrate lyase-like PEP mutase family enzyme
MPNAWDVGSARLLESLGFPAVATTSSGFAASLGRHDQSVELDELVTHVAALASIIEIPLSVDSEDGYATDVAGLPETVSALADAGAAGISIEDYRPGIGILEVAEATERVGAYVEAAHGHGLTVTARAENHLYEEGDLDDTIDRLQAYADAGADVVYAPGLSAAADIARVVNETGRPVNALLGVDAPPVEEMTALGVRRLSVGGALTFAAYGATARAARELLDLGTSSYATDTLTWRERRRAFDPR